MAVSEQTMTPLMQRVKLQADLLVPLLRRLREELGADRANELVYPVLRQEVRNWTSGLAEGDCGNPVENWQQASDALGALFEGDVEVKVVRQDDRALDVDVTACRYAEFFRQLGEPELGTILTCELDDHIADQFAPDVRLSRSETIMHGAAICPFRFKFATKQSNPLPKA
jgi:hypothetical protein